MKLQRVLVAVCINVLWFQPVSAANSTCAQIFRERQTPVRIRQTEQSKTMSQLLRSNVSHYWRWAHLNARRYFKMDLADLLKHNAWVSGDGHNGNLGPMLVGNKLKLLNLDLDDAGVAPMILNFVHDLAHAKAIDTDISAKDMWAAYLKGLAGKKLETPEIVEESLDYTVTELREMQHQKALKNSINKKLKTTAERFLIRDKEEYSSIKEAVERSSSQIKVLDILRAEKERGGSAKANRYLLLTEYKNKLLLMDVKQVLPQGTSHYKKMGDSGVVFQKAMDVFWDKNLWKQDATFQLLKVSDKEGVKTYLLRPKSLGLLEVPNKIEFYSDYEIFEEVTIYFQNQWGLLQSREAVAKRFLMAVDRIGSEEVLEAAKAMAKDYRHLLEERFED